MRQFIASVGFMILMFSACNLTPSSKPGKLAVVITDASHSIFLVDTSGKKPKPAQPQGNIEEVLGFMDDVAKKMNNDGRTPVDIHFLAVSRNISDATLSAEPYSYRPLNELALDEQEADNNAILTEAKLKLVERSKNTWEKTCLLTTIEHAADMLQHQMKRKSGDSLHIIILSDMVEVCDRSLMGATNFSPTDAAKISASMKQIATMKPTFKLDDPMLTITIIDVAPLSDPATKDALTRMWTAVFEKLGYAKPIVINTGVPDKF